jgi:hypothetical protein
MDLNKRNKILGIIFLLAAIIIIIIVVPIFIRLSSPYYTLLLYAFGLGCLNINLFVLVIALVMFIYFFIRSRNSLKRKKTLTLIELIFGGIICALSIVGIGFLLHGFSVWYGLGSLPTIVITSVIPLLVVAFPGVLFLIHRKHLKKILMSND